MTETSPVRLRVRIIGVAIAALVLLSLWYNSKQMEALSRQVVSETTAQAKMRGTLAHQPFLTDSSFDALGTTYRVIDLFVDQATHDEYQFLVMKQVVHDSAWRLVISLSPAPTDANFAGQFLTAFANADTASLQQRRSEDGRRALFIVNIRRPFPDTVRFRVDTAVAPEGPVTPP